MSYGNPRRLIRTLRARLTVLHLITLSATLALFAVLAYFALARTLYRHHDDELGHQAEELAQRLSGAILTEAAIQQSLVGSSVGSRFVMVRDDHGNLLYRDQILQSTEQTLGQHEALVHAASTGVQTKQFFTVTLERSGAVRFICVPVVGKHAYVQIGDPLGDVNATLHAIAIATLPLVPLILLLSTIGGWLIARRALRPMQTITATLEDIRASDLSRRVDVTSTDAEVSDLAATLNHLLDRLQRAFEALRQFAGDVSHQIQTPLTVIKGTVESGLKRPERSHDAEVLSQVAAEVDDISAIVADLQAFAVADSPDQMAGTVNLSEVISEVTDIVIALGELKDVSVTSDVTPNIEVRGDTLRLKQIALNLGDNAVKYTEAGGRVDIRLRQQAGDAILQVIDSGIGIAAEHLPHVFERHFRSDSGSERPAGSGLGLAILKRIVDVHRGTVEVQSTLGRGSNFTVRLPLANRS